MKIIGLRGLMLSKKKGSSAERNVGHGKEKSKTPAVVSNPCRENKSKPGQGSVDITNMVRCQRTMTGPLKSTTPVTSSQVSPAFPNSERPDSAAQPNLPPTIAASDDSDAPSCEALSPEQKRAFYSKKLRDLSQSLVPEDARRNQNTKFIKVDLTSAMASPSSAPSSVTQPPTTAAIGTRSTPQRTEATEISLGGSFEPKTSGSDDGDNNVNAVIRAVESIGVSTADGTGEPPSIKLRNKGKNVCPSTEVIMKLDTTNVALESTSKSFEDSSATGLSQYTGVGTNISNATESSSFFSNFWNTAIFSCIDPMACFLLPDETRPTSRQLLSDMQRSEGGYPGPVNPCTTPFNGVGNHKGNDYMRPFGSSSNDSEDKRFHHSPKEAARFDFDDKRQTSFASNSSGCSRSTPALDFEKHVPGNSTLVPMTTSVRTGAKRILSQALAGFQSLSTETLHDSVPHNRSPERIFSIGDDSTISTKF